MFILDTNVISELRKAGDGKADANVVAWLSSVDAGTLYLSAITLMEIELGVLRIERRDPLQGAKLRAWVNHRILPEFADRTLSVEFGCGAPLRTPSCSGPAPRARRIHCSNGASARHDNLDT